MRRPACPGGMHAPVLLALLVLSAAVLPASAQTPVETVNRLSPRDPYLGVLQQDQRNTHEFDAMPVKLVQCIDQRVRLHRVVLYYDPPQDVLTLTVHGGGNLFGGPEVAVGSDGVAVVEFASDDSCPEMRIHVDGTAVALAAGYEVRVQATACGTEECTDPPSPLVFGRT